MSIVTNITKILLKIAKDVIQGEFDGVKIDKEALLEKYPQLDEQRATFVTLNLEGNLKGCIGSLIAHRTLLEDLIHNAKVAAFEDPRFAPLTKEEFKKVQVEISLLSTPQKVDYVNIEDLKSKIKINEDGVILKLGSYQSTFLPQVWEQLDSFESFFAHLCQKAGLGIDCLRESPEIYIYHVEKIK